MAWLGYMLGGIALGAIVLALYERRKGRNLRMDAPHDAQMSERGAHTEAERIRSEGVFLPGGPPGSY